VYVGYCLSYVYIHLIPHIFFKLHKYNFDNIIFKKSLIVYISPKPVKNEIH